MLIGVPAETTVGETRVAVTPETVKKLKAQGHTLRIQSGAGVAASVPDEAYVAAGADITDIELLVNSPGGSLFDGVAIQNMLRQHGAKITGRVIAFNPLRELSPSAQLLLQQLTEMPA